MEVKKPVAEDGDDTLLETSPTIRVNQVAVSDITIFIDKPIRDPSLYRDEQMVLLAAQPHDQVNIIINSPGGNLATALALIECLKSTQAQTKAIVIGRCYSAATFIAMSCDEIQVTDSAEFMIHTASFGIEGSTAMVKSHTDFTIKQVHRILDEVYKGFLTDKELEAVRNGSELWFDATETRARLVKRAKYLAKLDRKAQPNDELPALQQ